MPHVMLNPKNVLTLAPRAGRRAEVFWDATPKVAPPFFGLRVTAEDVRAFVQGYRAKATGEKRLATLGRVRALGLKRARELGWDLLRDVAEGADPVRARRERRHGRTLAELVAEYIAHGKTRRGLPRAAKTQGIYRRILTADLKRSALGRMLPAEVQAADIERALKRKAGAPVSADRVLALLRAAYRWALRRGELATDPTVRLDRVIARRERERVLSADEIRALWAALDSLGPVLAGAVRVLLLLGTRLSETLRMRWADLDLATRPPTWTIPGEFRKGGRSLVVPLPAQAARIIEDLRGLTGRREYVFAGPRGASLAANPARLKAAIDDALRVAGEGEPALENWRIHDLRRTCASGAAALGASENTVSRVLGHKFAAGGASVTRVYQRFDRLPEVAAALAAWAAHVERLVSREGEAPAAVVPLARRAK